MNTTIRKQLNAYEKVGVDTGVDSASPYKLIAMLYEASLAAIANARYGMEHNDIAVKGESISKAIAIIEEGLRLSLNKEVGGELAQNLDDLYEYMTHRLLTANLRNDQAALDEVARLLKEIKGAWDAIGPQAGRSEMAASEETPPPASARPSFSYGKA